MLDWRTYATYGIAVFFGFILRWVNERRRNKQVDTRFQAVCSIVVSYLAYLWYVHKKVELCSIEFWLCGWSYFASLAVTIADDFFVHGWKAYFRIILNKFITYSLKEDNETTDHK